MPIAQEFKDLICEIQETLHHCGYDGSYSTFRELPNWAVYENYQQRSLHLLRRTFGEGSEHYLRLSDYYHSERGKDRSCLPTCLEIVKAAYDDYAGGVS